jgi:hypothetical protein
MLVSDALLVVLNDTKHDLALLDMLRNIPALNISISILKIFFVQKKGHSVEQICFRGHTKLN